MKFGEFLDQLYRLGLEYFRRYYGPYRATVVNNDDPEFRGRVMVECPRAKLSKNNGHWIMPMESSGPKHGQFWPPEIGAVVWIFFDNGDPSVPLCYTGGWYPKGKVAASLTPEAGGPKARGWTTPAGHEIVLSDKDGEEQITIMHKDGLIVKVTSDKVSVGAANGDFEPMMRGKAVKTYLENHTHSHSWGPTGVPIQPFPSDGLSDDTETS